MLSIVAKDGALRVSLEAPPQLSGEAYAWNLFTEQLQASADVAAICRILNGIERRRQGLAPCELKELPLKDALRLFALAKATVNSLDADLVAHAVEEVAHVICEGADGEYATLDSQSPRMKEHYTRHAQTAVNAYRFALEGRR